MRIHAKLSVIGSAAMLAANSASIVRGDVQHPVGVQTFENMTVGDIVDTLSPWFSVNDSIPDTLFTVTAESDVLGSPAVHGSSRRWLRIHDQDGGAVQNRFYSGNILAPAIENYRWTWYINLEQTPPGGGAVKPKLTIQHFDTTAFFNTWGIEFNDTGARLIVLGIGGAAASVPLYNYGVGTGIGDWVKLDLSVDFNTNLVTASANAGTPVTLPINLSGTADKKHHRFCYRGEGAGNVNKMLLDDVSVASGDSAPIPTTSEWGLAIFALLLTSAATVVRMRCGA